MRIRTCLDTKKKVWMTERCYQSRHGRVTEKNWDSVKTEALEYVDKWACDAAIRMNEHPPLPCKVIVGQIHKGDMLYVMFDECLIDGELQICEIGERSPHAYSP